MEQKSSIAIITARGGSKRIPRKNVRLFCGRPIIEYSIKAALEAEIFDEVMVSTDDEEISEIAKENGAKVPFFRSRELSDDYATTAQVIAEVLSCYHALGKDFDQICCIYPTAPFVSPLKLRKGMKLLEKGNAVLPVVKYSFPPQRAFIINEKGCAQYYWPENKDARSQDLDSWYHDSGQFYCIRMDAFNNSHSLIPSRTIPMIVPELEVQDIDTEEDWEIAELKYQLMINDIVRKDR